MALGSDSLHWAPFLLSGVEGLGFWARASGLGFRVQGSRVKFRGLDSNVLRELRVQGLGLRGIRV